MENNFQHEKRTKQTQQTNTYPWYTWYLLSNFIKAKWSFYHLSVSNFRLACLYFNYRTDHFNFTAINQG